MSAKKSKADSGDGNDNSKKGQTFLLIWLDNNFNIKNRDHQQALTLFRRVIRDVTPMVNETSCISYIENNNDHKICLISSGSLGESIVSHIHDMPQVDSIFIFCSNQKRHEQWAKNWSKIQGVFIDPLSICQALQKAVQESENADIPVHLVSSHKTTTDKSMDRLHPSFMYTQIIKEILLTIKFTDQHIKEFTEHCREQFSTNNHELENIQWFEEEYHDQTPIEWYTCDCFLYRIVNRSLKNMDMVAMIEMGFFITDLHRQLEKLHVEQYRKCKSNKYFKVFRGQSMSKNEFEELTKNPQGLIAFNKFLSTSKDRQGSLKYAARAMAKLDSIGVLFTMVVNPSQSKVPFASLTKNSYYTDSDEVLFSMHTVFRIQEIKPLDHNNRLIEITMVLTNDTDQSLEALTDRIRKEIDVNTNPWCKLVQLLIQAGQSEKAEEVCHKLLKTIEDDSEKGLIYKQLGSIKVNQGDYSKALEYYQEVLKIQKDTDLSDQRQLACSYDDIGNVYYKMQQYSEALTFFEKALKIKEKADAQSELVSSYKNIGGVYFDMNEYEKALSCYERALKIQNKLLPPKFPNHALLHIQIGMVHNNMKNYDEALNSYEKALKIQQECLPPNHPDVATSYKNIASVYLSMNDYEKALSYCDKALEIQKVSLPPDHPILAESYTQTGTIYNSMNKYDEALVNYDKALAIQQKSLPPNHPLIAVSYENIADVRVNMDDHEKALSYYEKALVVQEKSLRSGQLPSASIHKKIGKIYRHIHDYQKALSYYEKALHIQQNTLSPDHPDIKECKEKIEKIKKKL